MCPRVPGVPRVHAAWDLGGFRLQAEEPAGGMSSFLGPEIDDVA